jgi:hypothetical protein
MSESTEMIREAALAEIEEEDRRCKIDAEKARIRERMARPWWSRVFPWRITVKRIT